MMNSIEFNKHYLIGTNINYDNIPLKNHYTNEQFNYEYDNIMQNFCGNIINNNNYVNFIDKIQNLDNTICYYLCGDITLINQWFNNIFSDNFDVNNIYIIGDFSYNIPLFRSNVSIIGIGSIPLNMYNCGILLKNVFSDIETIDTLDKYINTMNNNINIDKNYFKDIIEQHNLQNLTESNKLSSAFRKGIYITNINKIDNDYYFKLLRCSSNFEGPTDNLRDIDKLIINHTNNIASKYFSDKIDLNHVLAQLYINDFVNGKEKKAKIKVHSDKTKDMDLNGGMAFCTFYDNITNLKSKDIKCSTYDKFDYCYGNCSIFTTLHFKLKLDVNDDKYIKQFSIILYPNSLFLIPLNINRLYTHEIRPSPLPIDKLPTRLGYVIRCSNTNAVHKNGKTYIIDNNTKEEHLLYEPTENEFLQLKELYYQENITSKYINYNDIYFTLNKGDHLQPLL